MCNIQRDTKSGCVGKRLLCPRNNSSINTSLPEENDLDNLALILEQPATRMLNTCLLVSFNSQFLCMVALQFDSEFFVCDKLTSTLLNML